MNECAACGLDFSSTKTFDWHRVGTFDYTLREGLALGREDGRRCLDADELRARGWRLDKHGRWYDPEEAARTRASFASLESSAAR